MKSLVFFVGSMALTACGSAEAITPDPANPAHCVAAFHYGRTVMLSGKKPDIKGALTSTARSLFEMKRLQESGDVGGNEVGTALLSEYAKNDDVMMKLLKGCFEKQDSDPAFQAANSSGTLMATARKVDPVCKSDAACLAGKKY